MDRASLPLAKEIAPGGKHMSVTERDAIDLLRNPLFQKVREEARRITEAARKRSARGASPERVVERLLLAEGMEAVFKLFDKHNPALAGEKVAIEEIE